MRSCMCERAMNSLPVMRDDRDGVGYRSPDGHVTCSRELDAATHEPFRTVGPSDAGREPGGVVEVRRLVGEAVAAGGATS